MEARLNDSMRSLANATAQAQREQSERRRFEHRAAALAARLEELHNELKNQLKNEGESRSRIAELEQRLSKRTENEFQSRADLEQESSEKKALEDRLTALGGMNDVLRQQVSQLEKATDDFKSIQNDLESRLKASTTALELANERLKQETADRAKLQSELQKAKESNQAEAREHAVELARLRSTVQAETLQRRRAESEAVQARCGTVEAERASNAALTKFQQRVRTPVSTLMQDVGRLLESELAPEQRELAEGVLANAALVQTNLQDLSTSLAVRRKATPASNATPPALPSRGGSPAKPPAETVKETSF
jgi:chromosome segregation ATPase